MGDTVRCWVSVDGRRVGRVDVEAPEGVEPVFEFERVVPPVDPGPPVLVNPDEGPSPRVIVPAHAQPGSGEPGASPLVAPEVPEPGGGPVVG